jgi:clorobiocin biosynthesis protein CloN7
MAQPQPLSAEAVATSERFFGHGLLPIALYPPDFTALRAASTRVMVAGGTTSKGEFAQRTAVELAQRLGTPLIDFPGGHAGFVSESKEFAVLLRRCLA